MATSTFEEAMGEMVTRDSLWIGFGGLMVLAGCGPSVGSQPIADFPSREALTAIAQGPPVKPAVPKTAGLMDQWQIEMAPRADAAQTPWEPIGPWEKMFADVARNAQPKPRLTIAMSCIAQELGRFFLEHQAEPDERLERFIVGGCGGLVPHVRGMYLPQKVAADAKDDKIFAELSSNVKATLQKSLGSGADSAGFWFGRREDRSVAYLVTAREPAQIKPFSLTPNDQGEVVIEGQMNQDVAYFEALINYGSAAVQPCDIDLSVTRPAFRFICTPASVDPTAWIQMLYAPPRRVLASVFAQALVRKDPDAPPSYEALRYADPTPVATSEEFTKAVIQQLNHVRAAAKLQPVTLAKAQSATAATLAPHYFASLFDGTQPETADTIALGLLAGWEVGGMIRSATLMSAVAPTLDAGRWLTSALEMPIGRHTLFAPEIEQVAFGPLVLSNPDLIGAVVTGYRFHHGSDHSDDVKLLLTRVVQSRRRMGLPPPLRLGTMAKVMQEELSAVHVGLRLPSEALDRVLERAVTSFGMGMRGYIIEASSLDELQVPDEVLNQPTLHLDIGVTHHKAPGAAWAQYTILVVYAVTGTNRV